MYKVGAEENPPRSPHSEPVSQRDGSTAALLYRTLMHLQQLEPLALEHSAAFKAVVVKPLNDAQLTQNNNLITRSSDSTSTHIEAAHTLLALHSQMRCDRIPETLMTIDLKIISIPGNPINH